MCTLSNLIKLTMFIIPFQASSVCYKFKLFANLWQNKNALENSKAFLHKEQNFVNLVIEKIKSLIFLEDC